MYLNEITTYLIFHDNDRNSDNTYRNEAISREAADLITV